MTKQANVKTEVTPMWLDAETGLASQRLLYILTGVFTTVLALVIWANPWAFFTDVSAVTSGIRAFELAISVIGWVALLVAPALIMRAWAMDDRYMLNYLPFVALLWPVSVVVIQLTLRLQFDKWYVGYYVDRPVFLLTDIVIPAAYFWIWRTLMQYHALEIEE